MNYRLTTLLGREAHTADVTKVIDVDVRDPISRLVITWEPTNGSQAAGDAHPVRGVSKIELVDGSDVLFSLSGAEAQAADWYHTEKEPANVLLFTNGMNSEQIMNINFGRYLWDPILALDPTKFTNLQLKITLDIDGGGSLVTTGYLTVLADLFDGKAVSPTGFLMHKEIKDFTLANASHEYTDLPTDYPYRKLFVRAQRYGTGPEYQIDTLKLSEDVDKKVVVNQSLLQILRSITSRIRPYRESIIGPGASSAQYFFCTPTYWPMFAATGWRASIGGGDKNIYEGDGGRFKFVQTASGPNWQALVEGHCPHGVIEIPFGLQDDIEDWYNVAEIGSLKLDIKGGSSVGSSETCQIFLQQLRNYGGA